MWCDVVTEAIPPGRSSKDRVFLGCSSVVLRARPGLLRNTISIGRVTRSAILSEKLGSSDRRHGRKYLVAVRGWLSLRLGLLRRGVALVLCRALCNYEIGSQPPLTFTLIITSLDVAPCLPPTIALLCVSLSRHTHGSRTELSVAQHMPKLRCRSVERVWWRRILYKARLATPLTCRSHHLDAVQICITLAVACVLVIVR